MNPQSFLTVKEIPWVIIAYNPAATPEFSFGNFTTAGALGLVNTRILTSKIVPESIVSSKPINYDKQAIPGGKTAVQQFGNFGAKEIEFSLKYARFNELMGVSQIQRFFEHLRYPAVDGFSKDQSFQPNPKVIYWYGTGNFPMHYFVEDVKITTSRYNRMANPQVVEVALKFTLDEQGALYELETTYMQLVTATKTLGILFKGKKPANPYVVEDTSKLTGVLGL